MIAANTLNIGAESVPIIINVIKATISSISKIKNRWSFAGILGMAPRASIFVKVAFESLYRQ